MKCHDRKSRVVAALAAAMLITSQASLQAQTNLSATTSDKPVALAPAAAAKPAWLSELSLGIHEGYDDNVFRAGSGKNFSLPPYTLPQGGVAAVKGVGSYFTTISPKMVVDFSKCLGNQDVLQVLSLTYAPDFVQYGDTPTENYNAHRFAAAIAGKVDNFSFNVDEGFTYIDGSKIGPSYPGSSWYTPYGQGVLRERREQSQDRTTVTLQYDQDDWFFRPTASLLDYSLDADMLSTTTYPGYLNYVDRYDANAGGDLGYKVDKDFAVTVGYRAGHQYQQKLPYAVDNYQQTASSDYQRLLVGFEGKLASWLDAKYQGGPDYRTYDDNAPVRHQCQVDYYGEGALTAKASKDDTISLNYRQWEWVSSTAKQPYYDSSIGLTYKHNFCDKVSGTVGASLGDADYNKGLNYTAGAHTPGTAADYYRDDLLYTFAAGLKYDITANLSVDVSYTLTMGRNDDTLAELATMPSVQLPATKREFTDQLVSVGMKVKL